MKSRLPIAWAGFCRWYGAEADNVPVAQLPNIKDFVDELYPVADDAPSEQPRTHRSDILVQDREEAQIRSTISTVP